MNDDWPSAPPFCQLSGSTSFVEWSFVVDLEVLFWGFQSSGGDLRIVLCQAVRCCFGVFGAPAATYVLFYVLCSEGVFIPVRRGSLLWWFCGGVGWFGVFSKSGGGYIVCSEFCSGGGLG
ncbi:hypothetical protein A2U01_0038807, partial [Trifolium medium]|nr:hypothetical protein [Trifolium medium]